MSILHSDKLRNVKYIIALALAVIIGIFTGRFITDYETRYLLSRKFCGTYRGIDVYKCGEINDLNFIGHANMLESAPDKLVECCTEMYFTGDELSVAGKSHSNALGVTQDSRIFISTCSFDADVMYHELFHAYDNTHKATKSDEFVKAYEAEKSAVYVEVIDDDAYPQEFFAAAGAIYLLQPELLEVTAPKTYDYFEQLLVEN